MKSFNKRITASAMALLFAGIPLLFFFTLGAHKYYVTQFGKKGLKYFDKNHIERLILPVAKYAHLKKGIEINLNDSRYDILEVRQVGETLFITAFNDTHEKKLNEGIGKFHGPVKQSGIKFNLPDWVPPLEECVFVMDSYGCSYPNTADQWVQPLLEVDFPPPESASCTESANG